MHISKWLFSSLDCSLKGHIELAEGKKKSEEHGRGSIIIKSLVNGIRKEMKLHNVVCIPSFSSKLLSVKKLVMEDFDIYVALGKTRKSSLVHVNGRIHNIYVVFKWWRKYHVR